MSYNSAFNGFDVYALLARRALPLALTMLLWSALISGARLAFSAL